MRDIRTAVLISSRATIEAGVSWLRADMRRLLMLTALRRYSGRVRSECELCLDSLVCSPLVVGEAKVNQRLEL